MGTLEEIQKMRTEGLQDNQIISKLQEKGISYREISDSMSQSKIKAAVEGQMNGAPSPGEQSYEQTYADPNSANNSLVDTQSSPVGMQPSIMQQPQSDQPETTQEYIPSYPPAQNQNEYGSYNQGTPEYTGASLSTDTITEITEQIVSEKMVDMRKKMERMAAFKTEVEAKTESLEERLKRIEKMIDTLQVSVLRKVGDYVTHVEDIKKDLALTQETFSKLVPEHNKSKPHHTK